MEEGIGRPESGLNGFGNIKREVGAVIYVE